MVVGPNPDSIEIVECARMWVWKLLGWCPAKSQIIPNRPPWAIRGHSASARPTFECRSASYDTDAAHPENTYSPGGAKDRTICSLLHRLFESEVVNRACLYANESDGEDPLLQIHLQTGGLA